jgi:hypothetical protein
VRCLGDAAGYPAEADVDASAADTVAPYAFALGRSPRARTLYVTARVSDGVQT